MFSLEWLGPDTISDDERLGQDELAEVHGPLEDDGELTGVGGGRLVCLVRLLKKKKIII